MREIVMGGKMWLLPRSGDSIARAPNMVVLENPKQPASKSIRRTIATKVRHRRIRSLSILLGRSWGARRDYPTELPYDRAFHNPE